MAQPVGDVLAQMKDAISAEDYQTVHELTPSLFEAYDASRPDERAFAERAKSVARNDSTFTDIDGESANDAVSDYLIERQTAQMKRAGAMIALGMGLANDTLTELQESVLQLDQQERTLADKRAAASERVAEASLAALPIISSSTIPEGPFAVGEAIELTTVVSNAGDVTTSDLRLRLDSQNGLEVVGKAERTFTLSASESRHVTFTFAAEEAGVHRPALQLESTDELDTESVEVEILGFDELISRTDDRLTALRERITEASVSKGLERRLIASINAAQTHLSKAKAHATAEKQQKAETELSTAINQLGAVLNKLEADSKTTKSKSKGGFTASQTAMFEAITVEAIELIATTRTLTA